MARRKAVYYLSQPERIGEVADQINRVRNLYPESDYDLIIVWPVLRPVANESVMEILCRGLHTEQVRSREELLAVYQRVQQTDPGFLFLETKRHYEEEYLSVYGENRKFIASLTAEDQERGQQIRAKLHMPSDAQVVTLHVREGGYLPHLTYHGYRDSNIKNYYPAIQYLIDRGYWVVRIGDKSMQKLENFPAQVVDAPFHPEYEPFFDPYFIASCRFYLGVPSGPASLAHAFSVPKLITNSPSQPTSIGNAGDLYTYKKYFSTQLGRVLTYEEAITSPVGEFGHAHLFEQSEIRPIENTAAEILGATWEMDSNLEGSYPHREEAQYFHKHVASIEKKAHFLRKTLVPEDHGRRSPFYINHFVNGRMSLEFIRLNPGFLGHLWPEIDWQNSPPTIQGEPVSIQGLRVGTMHPSVAKRPQTGE